MAWSLIIVCTMCLVEMSCAVTHYFYACFESRYSLNVITHPVSFVINRPLGHISLTILYLSADWRSVETDGICEAYTRPAAH
jgi:hypothetical protein